jgi:uncharacterized protein YciI
MDGPRNGRVSRPCGLQGTPVDRQSRIHGGRWNSSVVAMIFVLRLIDKPDTAALRERVRPEHKTYLARVADRIAFAGPLVRDDGVTMIGSLLAIHFDSRDAVHAWLADEPFTRAGLYASTQIDAFVNLWPQRAGFAPQA